MAVPCVPIPRVYPRADGVQIFWHSRARALSDKRLREMLRENTLDTEIGQMLSWEWDKRTLLRPLLPARAKG